MNYFEFFRELTGHPPYRFQEGLGLRLLQGESLVFRAPTGSGKTWTTVAPFLYSLREGQRLADRLIYALPLRSLASSLHSTVFQALERLGPVERNTKDRKYSAETLYCSLQMGGEKNDPFFEGDLIFCTIDQVLSGYLMVPLSLPDRLANMVAGALPGSLLVLDEVHLLESGIAMGTVIEMLCRLKGLTQFVLMTATMSDNSMNWLAKKLGASVPELPETEIRQLPAQSAKRRVWQWRGEQLSSGAIISAHRGGRTLVIVNQVGRAQDLYARLEEEYRGSPTRVACLHSRFFPEDRERIERDLEPWFGKHASQTDVILVTTQVVEAGIDISADHILTELAPMNSLVQRAGRTARYVERCTGIVTVFEIATTRPYTDSEQESADTRSCLQEVDPTGENVDFLREQTWVERVHGNAEKADLANYENLSARKILVQDAIRTGDRGNLSALLRDIDTVNILLSSAPKSVEFTSKRWPKLLSVPRTSIWKLKELIQQGINEIWRAVDSEDESSPLCFDWSPVESAAAFKGCWLLALGPAAATYTEGAGLRLGETGEGTPVRYTERPPVPAYSYFYETWVDHVTRVMEQSRAMTRANSIGADKLDRSLDLAHGGIETLVELAVALHDIGKLSAKWQSKAWEYESARTGRRRGAAIAHTTKMPGERGPDLPPHAVEGAFAAMTVLEEIHAGGAWAVASAVARHHSPRARQGVEFDLIPEAGELVRAIRGTVSLLTGGRSRLELMEFSQYLEPDWEEPKWWPVYTYLVRRLRLADQAGTAAGVLEAAGGV